MPAGTVPAPAIEDYGIVGDGRTAALVSRSGSVDWMCAPRFDSPPLFGALLAGRDGGRFAITPRDITGTTRAYRDGTATLVTRWTTASGIVELSDGMVLDVTSRLLPEVLLVREVTCVAGTAAVEVVVDPRLDMKAPPARVRPAAGGVTCAWGSRAIWVGGSLPGAVRVGGSTTIQMRAGERLTFCLAVADREPLVFVGAEDGRSQLARSERWWRNWAGRVAYDGPERAHVLRSLITLRLLTYAPSGAPVAAPTTSLPEEPGGARNWDYRYAWPRDASLGTSAFLAAGFVPEAEAFLHWLTIASHLSSPRVDVLYDVLGRPGVPEHERDDVAGYRGSLPVRIGNAACHQHQLDVYGWIVDAAWQLHRHGRPIDPHTWRAVRHWADFAAMHWREPDAGIWERRDAAAHHVHSKAMGWQAIDRALRLAERYPLPAGRRRAWMRQRELLLADMQTNGVGPNGHYVARYGESGMDAALLLLSSIGLEDDAGARMSSTIDAVRRELDSGDGLLFRYRPGTDGLPGGEGAFVACSFWLVPALARLGRQQEAADVFASMCARANDVGLFGEQIDPGTGSHLGNFPQALSHASLVQAGLSLAAAG